MNFTLALIRHGKTKANEKKLYCGLTDLGLSLKGIKELGEFAKEGIYPESQLFFTSGMKRANATLRIIYGGQEYEVWDSLKEYNLGNLDMKSYEKLKDQPDYIAWIMDKSGDVKCPGGESRNEFGLRVKLGFYALTDRIKKAEVSSAAIVTHGGVIATVMETLFPGVRDFYEWQPDPGGGYQLCYDGEFYRQWSKIGK